MPSPIFKMQKPSTRRRDVDKHFHLIWADATQVECLEPRLLMAADSGVVQWDTADGGNGHGYQVIALDSGISWDDARLAAEAAGGHLVTINSAGENAFVADLINNPDYWHRLPTLGLQSWGPWMGAYRDPAVGDAGQGWQWVTGEDFDYTNWNAGQPDDTSENYAHFMASGSHTGGMWNNWELDSSRFAVMSYIIEFESAANVAPVITSDPTTAAAYDTRMFTHTITATDDDGDPLTFVIEDLPDWMTLIDHGDGSATISGTPQYGDIGSYHLTVIVADGENTAEQQLTIEVASVGEISGRVWDDVNGDGIFDADERVRAGMIVFLDHNGNGVLDDGEMNVLTDENGFYHFTGVQPGDHQVRVEEDTIDRELGEFFLRHRMRGRTFHVALNDAEYFQRTVIDENTFVIGFERGGDDLHDDMVLQFTRNESGGLDMQVLSRTRCGAYHLYDADGDKVIRNLGRARSRPGRTVQLTNADESERRMESVQYVTTVLGERMTDVDFALTVNDSDDGGDDGGDRRDRHSKRWKHHRRNRFRW